MSSPVRRNMTIDEVQHWILSALICAVASFPIGVLLVASMYKSSSEDRSDAIALCVMASVIGFLAVGAGRLIHRLNPISPFTLIGALPGIAGVASVTLL